VYFLRLEPLKRELASGSIGEREAVPYLLWLGGLTTLAVLLPYGPYNHWDVASAVLSTVVFVGGTLIAYRSNGEASGEDFLIRYICLNWVVGLRVVLLLVVPVVAVEVRAEEALFGEIPDHTTPIGALTGPALEAVLFWRLAVHLRNLSTAPRAT
jgi:hypothetical protein